MAAQSSMRNVRGRRMDLKSAMRTVCRSKLTPNINEITQMMNLMHLMPAFRLFGLDILQQFHFFFSRDEKKIFFYFSITLLSRIPVESFCPNAPKIKWKTFSRQFSVSIFTGKKSTQVRTFLQNWSQQMLATNSLKMGTISCDILLWIAILSPAYYQSVITIRWFSVADSFSVRERGKKQQNNKLLLPNTTKWTGGK